MDLRLCLLHTEPSIQNYFLIMKFAIIEAGGKQYKVSPGDILTIEKLDQEPGQKVSFDRVFLVASDDKKTLQLGNPYLKKVRVEGKVLAHGKGEKIVVYKKRPKKRYERKKGHRQPYSQVEITLIKELA